MDSTHFGKCMEVVERGPPQIGRDYVTLRHRRRRWLFDLDPLFDDFFSNTDGRDREYDSMFNPRKVEGDGFVDYSFGMHELAEAFFGRFSPDELGNFLEPLFEDSEESRDFVKDVRMFENRNLFAFPFWQNHHPGSSYFVLMPMNLSVDQLNSSIRSITSKSKIHNDVSVNYSPITRADLRERVERPYAFSLGIKRGRRNASEYLIELREGLLEQIPRVILPVVNCGNLQSLDIFDTLATYKTDTSGLEIVKERRHASENK